MILYPFPNVHWWCSFLKSPTYIDTNTFIYSKNKSYNKYSIINANGIQHLSIPLENGRNQRIPFSKIKISYHEDWQKQHWRSLVSAYNNSAFFEFYSYKIEILFQKKYEYLYEFNQDAFLIVCDLLKLKLHEINTLDFNEIYSIESYKYLFQNKEFEFNNPEYYQVFKDKLGFLPNVSILDVLFNQGTESMMYLKMLK